MIDTWDEINDRYNAIKDNKPKASRKLKELGEILASAYILDPSQASDMWQYIIDLNISDDINNAKFYVAQVYNKIRENLPSEDAAYFIAMVPERVQLMFLYGYEGDGNNLYLCLSYLIEGFVKRGDVDNAITTFEYFSEKFGGIDFEQYGIKKGLSEVSKQLRELLKNSLRYKGTVLLFFDGLEALDIEEVSLYVEAIKMLINNREETDHDTLKKILENLADGLFIDEFFEVSYKNKNNIDIETLCSNWGKMCIDVNNIEESDTSNSYLKKKALRLPDISYPYDGSWYDEETIKWFTEILIKSKDLLEIYFNGKFHPYFDGYILKMWFENRDWDSISYYCSKMLLGLQNNSMSGDEFWHFIANNTYRYSHVDITEFELNGFVEALVRIAVSATGAECYNDYLNELKQYVSEIGKEEILNKYGLIDLDDRTSSEKLFDYLSECFAEDKACDAKEFSRLFKAAVKDYDNKESELMYKIALNKNACEVIFKNSLSLSELKGKMLYACVINNDNNRALQLIELLRNNEKNPKVTASEDKKVRDTSAWWENEQANTICRLIGETVQGAHSRGIDKAPVTAEMMNSVDYLSRQILPYLTERNAKKVIEDLLLITDDDEMEDQFIHDLLIDVKIYTTIPRPKAYNNAPAINELSSEIDKSFSVLSKKHRTDVLSEILKMLFAVKDSLKPVEFSTWMGLIPRMISGETAVGLFIENKSIFKEWLKDASTEEITRWRRSMAEAGSSEGLDEFCDLVSSIKGKVTD